MEHYGLSIAEGSEITNLTVPVGTTFPTNDNVGELFFRTDVNVLYVRDNTTWVDASSGSTDALTLEGQAGSYYLDYNNLTNIPTTIDGGTF